MKGTKFLAVVAAVSVAAGFVGCNDIQEKETNNQQEVAVQTNEATNEVQDAGVQYMDPGAIEGSYQDKVSQRAMMDIVYNENEKYYEVKISWGSSAKTSTQWVMTAYDDGDTKDLTYQDCSCDNLTYKENGDFDAENVYTNGKGKLTVNDDGTITWIDDEEEKHIFERIPK